MSNNFVKIVKKDEKYVTVIANSYNYGDVLYILDDLVLSFTNNWKLGRKKDIDNYHIKVWSDKRNSSELSSLLTQIFYEEEYKVYSDETITESVVEDEQHAQDYEKVLEEKYAYEFEVKTKKIDHNTVEVEGQVLRDMFDLVDQLGFIITDTNKIQSELNDLVSYQYTHKTGSLFVISKKESDSYLIDRLNVDTKFSLDIIYDNKKYIITSLYV